MPQWEKIYFEEESHNSTSSEFESQRPPEAQRNTTAMKDMSNIDLMMDSSEQQTSPTKLNNKCYEFFNRFLRELSEKSVSTESHLNKLSTIKNKLRKSQYFQPLEFVDDIWEVAKPPLPPVLKRQSPSKLPQNAQACHNSCMSSIILSMEEEFMRETKSCCMQSRVLAIFRNCYKCISVIPENGTYYHYDNQKKQTWDMCEACYKDLKGKFMMLIVHSDDISNEFSKEKVLKNKWTKRTNIADVDEVRVSCYKCKKECHKICVNYTTNEIFSCRYCLIENNPNLETQTGSAIDLLPQSELTRYIETRINSGLSTDQKKIYVRLISSVPKIYDVTPRLREFFKKLGIPHSFPYMSKLLACFQQGTEDSVLMFFGLYVQEYGKMCPLPNQNCAYIGILDSVRVIKSYAMRRLVLFGVLTSYFNYLQHRGFEKAFLWVCPPIKPGVEYIFQRRPFDQADPTFLKLSAWYKEVMESSKRMGVVGKYGTLNELCGWNADNFRNLPYFSEDLWPDKLGEVLYHFDKVGVNRPCKRIKLMANPREVESEKGDLEVSAVTEKMLHIMEILKDSFFYMKFAAPGVPKHIGLETMFAEEIISSQLVNDRDNIVKFLRTNCLEFRDRRKIVYTTKFILEHLCFDVLECCNCKLSINGFGSYCCGCQAVCCVQCRHTASHCEGNFLRIIKSEPAIDEIIEVQNHFNFQPEYECTNSYNTSPLSSPFMSNKTSTSDDDYSEGMDFSDNAEYGPNLETIPCCGEKMLCK